MPDSFSTVLDAFSLLEVTAVMLALAYLVLVIQQNVFCWLAQLVSSFLYVAIFFQARLYMESALNLFFAAMAVYGWYRWTFSGSQRERLQISMWAPYQHGIVLTSILVLTVLFGII